MKRVSEKKNKKMSSTTESKVGLRRSLRLRLKASGTSLDVRSSRKSSQLKPETYFKIYFPSEKPKMKEEKKKRNLKAKIHSKRTSIPRQCDTKHQKRVTQKRIRGQTLESQCSSEDKESVLKIPTRKSKIRKNGEGMPSTRNRARVGIETTSDGPKSTKIRDPEERVNMDAVFLQSFTTERHDYAKKEMIRFCDVAFLDDEHILALEDNNFREKFGHRICCFSLDGTLLCELPLPAHPWSIVVISPTEVVVSLRDRSTHGLLWLSVDVSSRSIEVVRNVPLDNECYGLDFNGDIFALSFYRQNYISLLNRTAEEIGRIPVSPGAHYRCLFINDRASFIYLDHHVGLIKCLNLDGKELFTLEGHPFCDPIALSKDNYGNIFVGSYRNGNVGQYDGSGKYLGYLFNTNLPSLCGMAINTRSDLMAISHDDYISLYKLTKATSCNLS